MLRESEKYFQIVETIDRHFKTLHLKCLFKNDAMKVVRAHCK